MEETSKSVRNASPTKFPPTMRVGDVPAQAKVTAAKTAAAADRACCGSVGSGIWLRRVERDSADSDFDQKRSRGKHDDDKAKNSAVPSGKGESSDLVKHDPQCAASTVRLLGYDHEGAGVHVR